MLHTVCLAQIEERVFMASGHASIMLAHLNRLETLIESLGVSPDALVVFNKFFWGQV